MATLNRDALLKASQRLKLVKLEAGEIYIKTLSAAEVFSLKDKTSDGKPNEQALFELAAGCICDENGKLLLTPDDVSKLDMMTINTIITAIYEFNNMNPEAVKKAKAKLKNLKTP